MDGLLLDTEDLYSLCINLILEKYNKPHLPWSIKAQLQGRPGPQSNEIFHTWAKLPVPEQDFMSEYTELQRKHFPTAKPLPGVEKLLADLERTRYWNINKNDGAHRVHIALATSSNTTNFTLKTSHLTELFSVFETDRRVLGDDPRVKPGRGKPLPDIYLLALKTINDGLATDEKPITPEECLVFEDSVPGVEAGRRAGMRVVWVPHPMLKKEYEGKEDDILAARTGQAGDDVDPHQLGEVGDGWAEYLENLVQFPYQRYGVVLPPPEAELEMSMKEVLSDGLVVQDIKN